MPGAIPLTNNLHKSERELERLEIETISTAGCLVDIGVHSFYLWTSVQWHFVLLKVNYKNFLTQKLMPIYIILLIY